MKSDKNVLITGGAGFVGQHLVKAFCAAGINASVYDVADVPADLGCVSFIKGDIFNQQQVREVVAAHDVIIHLIGLADSGLAQKDPRVSFDLNVGSLMNILEAARVVDDKKIVFPSSAAVYGVTEDLPIKENFPLNPTNMYAWHKYFCERLLVSYHANYNLDYIILRLFNVYGKGNKGVIDCFINKAQSSEPILSFGPYQYRDFVYAGDVAQALFHAALYEKASNRAVNIGSGTGFQIREILDLVCELFPEAKWEERKSTFTMYDSIADITLAKILLDFEPSVSREFLKKVIMEEMV